MTKTEAALKWLEDEYADGELYSEEVLMSA